MKQLYCMLTGNHSWYPNLKNVNESQELCQTGPKMWRCVVRSHQLNWWCDCKVRKEPFIQKDGENTKVFQLEFTPSRLDVLVNLMTISLLWGTGILPEGYFKGLQHLRVHTLPKFFPSLGFTNTSLKKIDLISVGLSCYTNSRCAFSIVSPPFPCG